ncbi:hypothetical protein [Gilliamella sp. G0441]|uniref:hypothetical protein n=1 Tax=Gilliamella sp. G0441 TaxID=3384760 RepID=UPI003D34DBA5
MWKNISAYLNKNRFLNTALSLFFCFIILCLAFNQYYFIAGIIFYITTVIYIVTRSQQLLHIPVKMLTSVQHDVSTNQYQSIKVIPPYFIR